MSHRLSRLALFALLGSTALAPYALAQEGTTGPSGDSCAALAGLIEENPERLREEWITTANTIVERNDATQCTAYYEQASGALDENAQRGTTNSAAAQIVVTQPDPEVTVQQQSPQVAVSQQQPTVSVDQGQPEVLVRQASPRVSVQVPQPIITIEQPQPEIIIRMPDPQVAVSSAQPQVEVRQGQPRVSVEQAEPQVSVRGEQGSDGADINVQQAEPNVQLQTAEGQPQVDGQRQQPLVRFEAAEPQIEVQPQGEPEIRFSQSGEPTVRFEEGTSERQTAAAEQQEVDEQQTGSIEQSAQQSTASLILSDGRSMPEGQMLTYAASDLIGNQLYNHDNVELGRIESLVEANGAVYVVLASDSVLGDGSRGVVLPADNLQLVDNTLMLRGLTEEEYATLSDYRGDGAERLETDATIEIATL